MALQDKYKELVDTATAAPVINLKVREQDEVVTLVRKENDQWWFIKTDAGEEGYSFTQYLTPVE